MKNLSLCSCGKELTSLAWTLYSLSVFQMYKILVYLTFAHIGFYLSLICSYRRFCLDRSTASLLIRLL